MMDESTLKALKQVMAEAEEAGISAERMREILTLVRDGTMNGPMKEWEHLITMDEMTFCIDHDLIAVKIVRGDGE